MTNLKNSSVALAVMFMASPILAQTNQDMKESGMTQQLFIYHLVLTQEYQNLNNWTDDTYSILNDHGAFLTDLGAKGILAFAGRTQLQPGDENLFGIAVIKAVSIVVAQEIMKPDPAVVANIQKASIFPFSMGIRYLENLTELKE